MSGSTSVAGGLGLAGFILLLQFSPNFAAAASPLRLECSAEQLLPGRALVCEYSMLGALNAQLADLHDGTVQARRAGRTDARRWLATRDACQDVDCLDRFFEAAIRDAKLALVDVESREPTVVLANARGVPVRLLQAADAPRPPSPRSVETEQARQSAPPRLRSIREPTGFEALISVLTVLFLAAVAVYAMAARRLVA